MPWGSRAEPLRKSCQIRARTHRLIVRHVPQASPPGFGDRYKCGGRVVHMNPLPHRIALADDRKLTRQKLRAEVSGVRSVRSVKPSAAQNRRLESFFVGCVSRDCFHLHR